jgi:hypothetical protein
MSCGKEWEFVSKQKNDCLNKVATVGELTSQRMVKGLLWVYLPDPYEIVWSFNSLRDFTRPTRLAVSTVDGI